MEMRDEVAGLKRQVRRLRTAILVMMILFSVVVMTVVRERLLRVYASSDSMELRVKRLAVVDDKGVERVVIAAPVPDPMIHGKRVKRNGAASGIIIYDTAGNERGGYLTSDESSNGAMLTLDGTDHQVLTLYANPDNGATVSLNNQKGDGLTLTTWDMPVIQMRRGRQSIFKQPPDAPDLH
jgi:hypothetical protein